MQVHRVSNHDLETEVFLSTSFGLSFRHFRTPFRLVTGLISAGTLFAALASPAQSTLSGPAQEQDSVQPAPIDSLPDSPGTLVANASSSATPDELFDGGSLPAQATNPVSGQTATASASPKRRSPHLAMTVQANEISDPMSPHDKFVGGLRDSVSLFSAAGWISSAAWAHAWNGSPNYGTDSGAFGERLGAATIRGISEGIFTNSVFAPLFREDPRYYVMGHGHNFFKRAFYAGTRVLITRTDSNRTSINFASLAGNAAGSGLTVTYYPSQNTSAAEVAKTFAGSLGGSAVGNLVDEFLVDALVDLHLRKQQP
jgi:hypothetical protein